MTKAEALAAVAAYLATAWPVSSLTKSGAWRAAWAASHIPGIGLIDFENIVTDAGYTPRQYGGENGPWILRLPGPSEKLAAGCIKCEGF